MRKKYAIVGGGPKRYIPDLTEYQEDVMTWVGADQGAVVILENNMPLHKAIGDFDSVDEQSFQRIKEEAKDFSIYPNEKDETDLELALQYVKSLQASELFLFGVTGGRLDHALINIQLLYPLWKEGIKAAIIDAQNKVELVGAGSHKIHKDSDYQYVSFLPVTLDIRKLSLSGFSYPLNEADLSYGSTRCISNYLIEDEGTFSFTEGILLVIRSKDINY
ncbi:thiamine diphosphokinase [Halobacillus sp. A1]|uniref:thiamine diphosphokinase n=1 Tax=Halobacillus sp. A1 TaxID=2880262 RepID=UPI0020A6BB03|nr:thiamine diphosphokinase [Halobacillus sp. A1]MCP3031148.1 thiamine diphosphokinase [Halobacillus sp. A1]